MVLQRFWLAKIKSDEQMDTQTNESKKKLELNLIHFVSNK